MFTQDPKKQDPKPQEKPDLPPDLQKLVDEMHKSQLKMMEDIFDDLEKLIDPITPPPPGTPTVGYPLSATQFLSSSEFKNLGEADQLEIQKYIAEKNPKLVLVRNDTAQPDRFYFSKAPYNTGRYIHIGIDDTYNTKTKWQQGLEGDDYTMLFKSQPPEAINNAVTFFNLRLAELDKNPVKKPVKATDGLAEYAGPYTILEFTGNKYFQRQFKGSLPSLRIEYDLLSESMNKAYITSPDSIPIHKDPTRIYMRYEPNSNFDWPLTGILVGHVGADGKKVYVDKVIDIKSHKIAELGFSSTEFTLNTTNIAKNGEGTKIEVPNAPEGLTNDSAGTLHAQMQKIPSLSVKNEIHTHDGKTISTGPLNVEHYENKRRGEVDDFMRSDLHKELWKTLEGRKKIEAIYAQRDTGNYSHIMIVQNTNKSGETESRVIFGKAVQSDEQIKHAITGEAVRLIQFNRAMNVETEEVRPMRPFNVQATKMGTISPREVEETVEIIRDAVNRRVISAAPEKNPLFDQILAKGVSASSVDNTAVVAPVTPMIGDKKLSVA